MNVQPKEALPETARETCERLRRERAKRLGLNAPRFTVLVRKVFA